MTINRTLFLREIRDLLIFLGVSVMMGFLACSSCTARSYAILISFNFLIWTSLWKGNAWIASYLSDKISWIRFPVKRFLLGILTMLSYTILAVISLISLYKIVFNANFGAGQNNLIYVSIAVTIIISLFLHGRDFLLHWKEATLEKEKYEKESIQARYESLKSQVDPHFLFNSLNALTNLVYDDQDKAVKFIKQLSEVYRYVLDSRDKEIVFLEEELKFLEAYTFLQQIRFGTNLQIDNQLKNTNVEVAPLALQLLVENAIKHNVISSNSPLLIKLYQQDDFFVVENKIKKKEKFKTDSNGMGLQNIIRRYDFLSDKEVEVENDGIIYRVKLPVLHRSRV
jgi:sensor histidine kinase YesM